MRQEIQTLDTQKEIIPVKGIRIIEWYPPEWEPDPDDPIFDDEDQLAMAPEEEGQLLVVFEPENATNKRITWKTNDPTIATVDDNGKVTATGCGYTEIIAISEDGKHRAEQNISIHRPRY